MPNMKQMLYALGLFLASIVFTIIAFLIVGLAAIAIHLFQLYLATWLPQYMPEVLTLVEWCIFLFDIYVFARLIWFKTNRFFKIIGA